MLLSAIQYVESSVQPKHGGSRSAWHSSDNTRAFGKIQSMKIKVRRNIRVKGRGMPSLSRVLAPKPWPRIRLFSARACLTMVIQAGR